MSLTELDLEIEEILDKIQESARGATVGRILCATASYRHRRAALALETLKTSTATVDLKTRADAELILGDYFSTTAVKS